MHFLHTISFPPNLFPIATMPVWIVSLLSYQHVHFFYVDPLSLNDILFSSARTNEVAKKKLQKDLEKVRQKYKKEGLKNKKKKIDRPLK